MPFLPIFLSVLFIPTTFFFVFYVYPKLEGIKYLISFGNHRLFNPKRIIDSIIFCFFFFMIFESLLALINVIHSSDLTNLAYNIVLARNAANSDSGHLLAYLSMELAFFFLLYKEGKVLKAALMIIFFLFISELFWHICFYVKFWSFIDPSGVIGSSVSYLVFLFGVGVVGMIRYHCFNKAFKYGLPILSVVYILWFILGLHVTIAINLVPTFFIKNSLAETIWYYDPQTNLFEDGHIICAFLLCALVEVYHCKVNKIRTVSFRRLLKF